MSTGEVNNSKRSGRPMKSTVRQRKLLSLISKILFWTVRELWIESKILQNISLCAVKPFGKIIKWWKAYSAITSVNWSKVIFSTFSAKGWLLRKPNSNLISNNNDQWNIKTNTGFTTCNQLCTRFKPISIWSNPKLIANLIL